MGNNDMREILVKLVDQLGTIHGKKAFQKLVYFLQEAEGVPLGLEFQMHFYGPYSPSLDMHLHRLALLSLLDLSGTIEGPIQIKCTSRGQEAIKSKTAYEDEIGRLFGNLAAESPRKLELLTTTHYLAKRTRYDGSQASRERLVTAVKAWKESRFRNAEIAGALKQLRELRYLN